MKVDQKYGVEFTTVREIKLLGQINHPSIISLKKVFFEENTICM